MHTHAQIRPADELRAVKNARTATARARFVVHAARVSLWSAAEKLIKRLRRRTNAWERKKKEKNDER